MNNQNIKKISLRNSFIFQGILIKMNYKEILLRTEINTN